MLFLASAFAGVGTTLAVGGAANQDASVWAPTLDYRTRSVLVQLHALDALRPLVDGGAYLVTGVDVTAVVARREVAPRVEGVLMVGGGAAVDTANFFGWLVAAEARLGAEVVGEMGLGLYVVPYVGATNLVLAAPGATFGGTLQVSAWFAK